MPQRIGIISVIVTFNGLRWLDKTINSLKKNTIPLDILVIDNYSSDGTNTKIKNKHPEVKLIESGTNLGFGKANNIGLKEALKGDYEYVFLINQDAWIEPGTIKKLIAVHKEHLEYGIISPMHLAGDGINLDNSFSNYITGYYCPGLVSDIYMNRPRKRVYETRFVNAAFWLLSRACFQSVGGFDPLFFHYGEDDDYVSRARYHGFKIGICPDAIGYHDRPQEMKDSGEWSLERLYSSKLIGLKDLNIPLPPKSTFTRRVLKQKLASLISDSQYERQIWVNKKIIENYHKIASHRELCQRKNPTFLND